jgi:hypothetical protein
LRTDLTTETSSRVSGDSALGTRIDGEISTRNSQIATLTAADIVLTNNLNTEVTNRVNGDSAVNTRVTNLTNSVNSSFSNVYSNINSIQSSLSDEISARTAYDGELLKKIDILFQYFFRQSSCGAYIDENNQIQFMYGHCKDEAFNNNNNY